MSVQTERLLRAVDQVLATYRSRWRNGENVILEAEAMELQLARDDIEEMEVLRMTEFAAMVKGIRKVEVDGGPAQVELTILLPLEFGTHVHLGDFLPIRKDRQSD